MIKKILCCFLATLSTIVFSAASTTAGVKEDGAEIVAYCKSIAKNKDQLFACLEKQAESARPEIDCVIARLYYKEGNMVKAITSLKKAAGKGYTEAKLELARIYFSKNSQAFSCDKAVYWLKEAINDDSEVARVRLANIYIFQKCDCGSSEEAYELLLPIAKKGNANAQLTLGLMYKDGVGVSADKEQAEYWLNAAAGNTHPKVREIAREALAQF